MRVLVDTNVFIPLEDTSPLLNRAVADFARLTSKFGWQVLVHPASGEDLSHDKQADRRVSVLSRLAKYERVPHPPEPPADFLEKLGNPTVINDICDARILYAVAANAVGMLVTEDRGIHAKAKRVGIDKRVYFVTQAVQLIEQLHGEKKSTPPAVKQLPMHTVDLKETFFDSLRGRLRLRRVVREEGAGGPRVLGCATG
jgi:hypothetical protein